MRGSHKGIQEMNSSLANVSKHSKAGFLAQNSSQKLKEKTQPQGGIFLPSRKAQEKKSILLIFLLNMKFFLFLEFFGKN